MSPNRDATATKVSQNSTKALAIMSIDRRTFLQLLSTGALSAAFPPSIARALSIPAHNKTGTINDVEHIVIMMQENRSFDHYYGTLRGVRGFGDNRVINLPNGNPVWYQPNNNGYLLPFHPGAPNLGLQFIEDLAHDWTTTHAAWNLGKYDQWVPNKGTTTMAHLVRSDIPFHYALADAFTICDAYHCSLFGPTDPNRYYMWTGWVGNDGSGGGPVVETQRPATVGRPIQNSYKRLGYLGRFIRTSDLGLQPNNSGVSPTTPILAITVTIRSSTSISTRTHPQGLSWPMVQRPELTSLSAEPSLIFSAMMSPAAICPRFPGWSPPKLIRSTRIGLPTMAPGMSRKSSML
jgi:hypothetical protein